MKTCLVFLLFLLGINTLIAQPPRLTGLDTHYYNKEDSIKKNRHILLKSAIGVGYAGAVVLCYKLIDTREQDESQENKDAIKTDIANTLGHFGRGRNNWIACGSTAGFAYLTTNIKLQKTSVIWAASLLTSDFITNNGKHFFQRHRPDTGDPYNTFDWHHGNGFNKSMPSAHTSNAFTTATVFATMYKDKKWVPPLAYGIATLVGFSRIYDNAHWASDVMVGAAVGFLSAKAMVGLYRFAEKKFIFVIPQIGQKASSLKIIYKF